MNWSEPDELRYILDPKDTYGPDFPGETFRVLKEKEERKYGGKNTLAASDDALRLAVISRLGWIKRQQTKFEGQTRQSKREMVTGESHYFLGQRYRLHVVNHDGAARVAMRNKSTIELHVDKQTTAEQRDRLLQRWYRRQLKALIPPLLGKWQTTLGIQVADWGVKKMKTKWGSCNIDSRRV